MAKLLLGSVVGPQGPQGTPGVNGSQGPQGIPGPSEIAATTEVVGLTTGQLLYNNGGKVGSVEIVDNLLSVDPDKPLSANQGKVLKSLIDDNDSAIGQNTEKITQLSNPNLLINGDFQVWQRGEIFTNPDYVYTADRWCFLAHTPSTNFTVSKAAKGMNIVRTSGDPIILRQYFEIQQSFLGEKLTLSMKAQGEILKVTGIVSATPIITSKTQDGMANCYFLYEQGRLKVGIDVYKIGSLNIEWVKLELGEIATPFSPRPIAEELAICQRYYQKKALSGVATTTSIVQFDESFSPQLRTTPTVAFTNLYIESNGNGNTSFTSASLTVIDTRAGSLTINGGTTVVGRAYSISDAIFDAEIY